MLCAIISIDMDMSTVQTYVYSGGMVDIDIDNIAMILSQSDPLKKSMASVILQRNTAVRQANPITPYTVRCLAAAFWKHSMKSLLQTDF